MAVWMIYVVAVSLLLGVAAFAAERAARLRHASTRWYWFATILASLLIPTLIASVSIQLPEVVGSRAAETIVVLRNATSIPISPQIWLGATDVQVASWKVLDPWLKNAWLTASGLMLLVLVLHGVQLYWRKRAWRRITFTGREVYVAQDVGPAVVGFLNPSIVVPVWLTERDPSRKTAVIAHEQSHLAAGDPQLFTIALCLLLFMPWNLPLWWQLRRLRNAIEVDCDARVLAAGQDATEYGETLIEVGERRSAFIGAVAAMSESQSFLEERIKIMMTKPKRWWHTTAVALSCLSLVLVATAAQVSPPNAQTASEESVAIELDAATLARYTGYYRLSEQQVLTVTATEGHLSMRLTGQPSADLYPTSTTHFFNKDAKAEVDFIASGTAPATAAVLQQRGRSVTMPRIDATSARQQQEQLSARVQNAIPAPGSDAAVRAVLEQIGTSNTSYESLVLPHLVEPLRKQAERTRRMIDSLGPLQAVEFQSVNSQGWDAYLARFTKGSLIVRVKVQGGQISSLAFQPL